MNLKLLQKKLGLWLILVSITSLSFAQSYTFSTSPPLNGGNGQYGITFELEAHVSIIVTQLGIKANTGTLSGVVIWYRPGGVQHITNQAPNVTPANGWIMAGTAPNFTSTSNTIVNSIPLTLNIPIPSGQKYGFCISKPSSAPTFVYTTGNGINNLTDTRITLKLGTNSGYGGPAPTPAFHPRNFNGSVTYSVGVPGGGGPVLPPIANFFPSQENTNTIPNDTLWLNSPSTIVSTSQNQSRVYWDLPNHPNLNQGYFRENVPFSSQQYIDTTNYNRTLKYTFNQRGFWPVRLLAVNYLKIDSLRDSTIRYIYVDTPNRTPQTDFITFKRKVGFGDYANFLDLTQYGPYQWSWTFDPPCNKCNNPPFFPNFFAGPSDQNPLIFGGDPGKYTICLQTWNSRGWDSICKKDYIEIINSYNVCSGSGSNSTTDKEGYLFAPSGPNFSYTRSQVGSCQGILIQPCADSITFYIERLKMLPTDSLVFRNGNTTSSPIFATVGGNNVLNLPLKFKNGIRGGSEVLVSFKLGTGAVPPNFDSAGFSIRWDFDPPTYAKPTAAMDIPDTIYNQQPVTYKSTSTGVKVFYSWDSDGNNVYDSVSSQFTRTYFITTPQVKNVCHVAYNCVGSDTICKAVVFLPTTAAPEARFTVDKFQGFNTDTFYFRDKSLNGASNWSWSFTPGSAQFLNGTNKNTRNPDIRFTQRTKYQLKLVVSNAYGIDSLTKIDYINIGAYDVPVSLTNINQADGSIGISRVILNDGIDTTTNPYTPDYQFVTGNQIASLYRGKLHTITVVRPTTQSPMDRKVWIDLNFDGIFDNNELVMDERNKSILSRTDTIVVGSTQRLGTTRMRVGVTLANTTLNPAVAYLGAFRDYLIDFAADYIAPTIQLIGDDELFTNLNSPYVEPGVIATDNIEGDISHKFEVFGTVNTSAVGPNYLKYIVKDLYGNVSDTVYRTVFVVLGSNGPTLTLNGSLNKYVEVFNGYVEPGFVAKNSQNEDITNQVLVSSPVDTATLGNYVITYSITDQFSQTDEQLRMVEVGDTTKPVITPKLNTQGVYEHQVGQVFNIDDAVDITDNYWSRNNLNVSVTGTVDANNTGSYILNYNATDGSANMANTTQVTVTVVDKIAPTIQLNGDAEITLEVYSNFNDPGVLVTDNYWPLNTILITTTGNLNTNVLGTYKRTYTAIDPSGNADSISRIIHVVDNTIPVITILGDNPFNLPRWHVYQEFGVALTDNYNTDAQMRAGLIVDNNLPLNQEGKPFGNEIGLYSVKYAVKDLSGNEAEMATRIIKVGEPITGINQLNNIGLIASIYPNPSNGLFNIRLVEPTKDVVSIKIYNAFGMEVFSNTETNGFYNKQLNLTDISKGMYFIQLQVGNNKAVQKLQIN